MAGTGGLIHSGTVPINGLRMKQNKALQKQTRELARAAQTFAAAGFFPNLATFTSSVEPAGKNSFSSADPTPMSLREMQRWLDAEAAVLAKRELARLDSFHNRPA